MVIATGMAKVHDGRRKAVTLLCIILASAPIMGISVYVDSFSLHDWDRFTDIGPVPLVIRGREAHLIVSQVGTVPEITNYSYLVFGSRQIRPQTVNESSSSSERIATLGQNYLETFPEVFNFYSGRSVTNNSEIAISRTMASRHDVDLGDILEISGNYGIWYNVTVVGLYDLYEYNIAEELTSSLQELKFSDGIVMSEVLLRDWRVTIEIHVNIDLSSSSPFDTDSTLNYLNDIDENIQSLYAGGVTDSAFYITNFMLISIGEYTSWVDGLRLAQIYRSWGMILLTAFIILLAAMALVPRAVIWISSGKFSLSRRMIWFPILPPIPSMAAIFNFASKIGFCL